ncbi:uncharacterized protein BXZ73DRAFT_92339 [Epithele typhae]|uniref:uncharacterized protein n=1 Tax=Epithele typhae TaxID=378194 RepID=UPI002007DEC5|nr:uncharacterized protein BXZ73DRAFT_92339 [Epithele typhae]KAH9917643.1 hypothetical protein BXZ73DRAFT_92339 [Epithele typhae]
MFSLAVQPALVSLFSSTGSDPLSLFASRADKALPSDSFICLLNDATSAPAPALPRALIVASEPEKNAEQSSPDYTLDQTVLHIQSPTLRTTFIRCPPDRVSSGSSGRAHTSSHLGLKHPWIHLQVRNMGREWAFEVGLVDQLGREGIVRCATFQKQPRLKLASPPLLLLPLEFPPPSSRPLTSWTTISLNLAARLSSFSSATLAQADDDDDDDDDDDEGSTANAHQYRSQVPSGTYSHVSYVKIYATCRLRRVWFGESGGQQRLPWEFQLYAADAH